MLKLVQLCLIGCTKPGDFLLPTPDLSRSRAHLSLSQVGIISVRMCPPVGRAVQYTQ